MTLSEILTTAASNAAGNGFPQTSPAIQALADAVREFERIVYLFTTPEIVEDSAVVMAKKVASAAEKVSVRASLFASFLEAFDSHRMAGTLPAKRAFHA